MRHPIDSRTVKIALAITLCLLGLALVPVLALPFDGLDWADYDPLYQDEPCCPAIAQATATIAPTPIVTVAFAAEIPCAELPLPGEPQAAVVNGQGIGQAAYEREFAQYVMALEASGIDPESPESQAERPAWRRQVLDLMIEDVLIQQAAVETGVQISDQEVHAQATVEISQSKLLEWFEDWLIETGQTRDEFERDICQGLLNQEVRDRITDGVGAPGRVRARHIVLATESQAQAALARLAAGRPFVVVAQESSLDAPTRDSGGSLGWLTPDTPGVPQQVIEAAFAGQPGQVQGPIQIDGRYVLVQTVELEPGEPSDSATLESERAAAFDRWLAERRAAAVIELFVD